MNESIMMIVRIYIFQCTNQNYGVKTNPSYYSSYWFLFFISVKDSKDSALLIFKGWCYALPFCSILLL